MKIPQARDLESGQLVRPDRAEVRALKGRYQCLDPKCNSDLIVAKSKYGNIHFRHHRGINEKLCRYSGKHKSDKLHSRAQEHLAIIFEEAFARKCSMPLLRFETPSGIKTVLPFIAGSRVVKEWYCQDIARRPDIAILDSTNNPVFFVEIKHTHAVDVDKRKSLLNYWWIEVEAKEIIKSALELNIHAHGNFPYEFELMGNQGLLF